MDIVFSTYYQETPMQLPSAEPDTLFEDLLQDLPPETMAMADEFKAFPRARKIKTPRELLRAVLLYRMFPPKVSP
jgi:hypothetical protein